MVVYDNDSYIHWFPIGLAYVASALRSAGHEVTVYNQDLYHWPEDHLSRFLAGGSFDVVGVSTVGGYYQYKKLLMISEVVSSAPNRPFYVIGGHGPAPEPEYFLKKTKSDAVVTGEGEITVVNLLNALAHGTELSTVKGIAYLADGKAIITERQPLIEDVDSIPYPAWDLFPVDYYCLLRKPHIRHCERAFPVLSARGCPFKCNFCYRMDKGCRLRSEESVVEEIAILRERYHVSYIVFADELLLTSSERAIRLSEAIGRAHPDIKWWCNGRLNYATPRVLKKMKEAGCVYINYGVECLDDRILKIMNKQVTTEHIVRGVRATLEAGISPGLNVIFGNIGENERTLQKGVDFLLRYNDHAELRTIRPVTPYPGSPLYYYAIENGLLGGVEDFYEHRHVNSDLVSVNFTELSDDEFHACLYKANETLLMNYIEHQCERYREQLRALYCQGDTSFRGFRQT